MFLTRMHLNPGRRGTRQLLGSPQKLHAAVLCGFAPDAATETDGGRVLWRLDSGADQRLTLYVSSPTEPDLTHLVEQAGWPAASTGSPWQTATTDRVVDRLAIGQRWRFRLTANPVHHVRQPGSGRGKPLGHVTVEQQRAWLADRAAGWGFDVTLDGVSTADVTGRRRLTFERRTGDATRTVTIAVATYDGVLTVADPVRLRHSLGHGVGRAKGYGCGLITLAPLS